MSKGNLSLNPSQSTVRGVISIVLGRLLFLVRVTSPLELPTRSTLTTRQGIITLLSAGILTFLVLQHFISPSLPSLLLSSLSLQAKHLKANFQGV